MIIELLNKRRKESKGLIAVLIDPGKFEEMPLIRSLEIINGARIDMILVGGSLISESIDHTLQIIRANTQLPVVLFPGSLLQLSDKADALLLLSLISGRNADYLIGNHVIAAPLLKRSKLEIIPTGYILVGNGSVSSTQYISNTNPIPRDKIELAVATAIAGELLGHKFIYLEGGSGSQLSVSPEIIKGVRESITIPLIVGGGIKNKQQVDEAFLAGADMVVIGNAFEENPEFILSL
ncbi:MAG: geranylgeranylglyceryl/heptaprenylglyceryl phosphate synthase [Bacteroidales bacterium]|nr:geranylgeranylglyceryl/heptaprenylglyceryl phosphate synthase [Bacteroidales bacterium]